MDAGSERIDQIARTQSTDLDGGRSGAKGGLIASPQKPPWLGHQKRISAPKAVIPPSNVSSVVGKVTAGLEKRAADIRQGLRYLPQRDLTPHEEHRQRLTLASKLHRIERKIILLRQGRLF